MKELTPEQIRDLQGEWVREQYRTELKLERDTWAKNKRIQRRAVREYKRQGHRPITKNTPKSTEI